MIARITRAVRRIAVLAYEQPLLDYCPNCAGNYPPSHFPCV